MTTPLPTTPATYDHPHGIGCACGVCELDPRPNSDLDKRHYVQPLKPGKESPDVREGDQIWVQQGEYKGCILDLTKIERTQPLTPGQEIVRYVCSRTSFPFEIRTRRVSLYRRWTA